MGEGQVAADQYLGTIVCVLLRLKLRTASAG